MKRAISGIKPTGQQPHLGNLLGMMQPCIALQNDYDNMLFIADYHALTTVHKGQTMRDQTFETALSFLSLGLDPEKTTLFVQSDVPEVTELTWILNCLTTMGLLERAHAFKDAKAKNKSVSAGLFTYPVLMAADILIYQNEVVPVGKDQKQHVEIARDIAEKFNHTFGETFVLPEPMINEELTIIGTDGQKMSKSYQNTIMLFEEEEEMTKKLMKYQTDPKRIRKDDPGTPEDCPAFSLHKYFTPQDDLNIVDKECRNAERGCVDCKKELTKNVLEALDPYRKKRAELQKNPDYIYEVLAKGGEKARRRAEETMEKVREKVGFLH